MVNVVSIGEIDSDKHKVVAESEFNYDSHIE